MGTPPVRHREGRGRFDRRDLAVGEVAGDEVTTVVLHMTSCTGRGNYRSQWLAGVCSLASMAARRRCEVVGSMFSAMAGPGKVRTGFTRERQTRCSRKQRECNSGRALTTVS
jgi:hypothetical protein